MSESVAHWAEDYLTEMISFEFASTRDDQLQLTAGKLIRYRMFGYCLEWVSW